MDLRCREQQAEATARQRAQARRRPHMRAKLRKLVLVPVGDSPARKLERTCDCAPCTSAGAAIFSLYLAAIGRMHHVYDTHAPTRLVPCIERAAGRHSPPPRRAGGLHAHICGVDGGGLVGMRHLIHLWHDGRALHERLI